MGKRGPQPLTQAQRTERFWAKVEKTDSCWLWTGATNNGYGRYGAKDWAHRFAYELVRGPIPLGLEIDHRCRNRLCVNPDHLRLATRKQNVENHGGANGNSRSGVRGVYPFNSRGTWVWQVQVTHHGMRYWGGYFPFDKLDDAAEAATELRRSLHTRNEKDKE